MDLPYIEPLLIYSEVGEWTHPEIASLTREMEKHKDGNLYGNIMRVTVTFPDNTFYLIATTDEKGMNEIMSGNIIVNQYMEFLFTILGEDVWYPGNEQFVFSDFGFAFNERYKLFTEPWNVTISLDVSLNHDETHWWFDT